jgi:peptidoglycan/LPS O-acetylase OafA/YrhL
VREALRGILKKIETLDGLRGLSIILVILGHCYQSFTFGALESFLNSYYKLHNVGVSLFFTLSGYLITKILLIEEQRKGEISLSTFFKKRFYRIFPAYYFYILALFITNLFVTLDIDPVSFYSAIFYAGWYFPLENNLHYFGHHWSLATEEHFYIVFPLLFAFFRKRRVELITFLILIAPIVRILNYLFLPTYKAKMGFLTHTRYDMILFGCLAAMVESKGFIKSFLEKINTKSILTLLPVFIFLINPALKVTLGAKYKYIIAYSLDGIAISLYILLMVKNNDSGFYRSKILSVIGLYSYSLYLWQQPFMHKFGFPLNILLTVLAALFSYHIIEKPFLKLKNRLSIKS